MVWTNAMGVAFTATLLSVCDTGATFEFPDVPVSTNTLSLAKLSPASAQCACRMVGYVPIPPSMAATFAQARRDLMRIEALEADGRMDAATANRRRRGVRAAFTRVCREKGIPDADVPALISRMEK